MSRREISISDNFSRFLSTLGSILAILTMLLMLFLNMNAAFGMNLNPEVIDTLKIVKEWAVVVVLTIVGLEFAVTKGVIAFILMIVLALFVIVLLFFPDVIAQLKG